MVIAVLEATLRGYLEGLDHTPSTLARHGPVDLDELRAHLLVRLREFGDQPWVAAVHREWMPRLHHLKRHVEGGDGAPAATSPRVVQEFAHRVLDHLLHRGDRELPLVDRLEIARVAAGLDTGREAAQTYALETRLVARTEDERVQPTRLGRMFLRLRGKDAVRWLLTNEVVQSSGDFDPWRASAELLREGLTEHGIRQDVDPQDGELYFAFASESLRRLNNLGVFLAHVSNEDEVYRYSVREGMRDVVRSALEPGPWHAGVRALIDDERASLVGGATTAAADATIEQTRMIAHEVRNALVPVRHHIDHLLALRSPTPEPRIDAVRRGVVRVLDFVDQMVSTSELLAEPTTSFEFTELVGEVLARLEGAERVEVRSTEVHARGPRSQLARALANVVENALQATAPAGAVRVTVRLTRRNARVEVDDGGPGVREDLRSRVFDDGFTTRPGGSGFGLFYLRRVVERDIGGRVWCEESDLGGARFVIEIPVAESTP